MLGSGLGYRREFRAQLFENSGRVDFLEIIADHYFDASPERLAELDLLAAHFPIVAHGLDLSPGSAEGLDENYLGKLARLIERINPPWFSEHLCFTKADGVSIGHLAALPCTNAAIDAVARNVDALRARIKTPLLLENITTVVPVPGGRMDEPEFLSRVLERTGCGWLCDIANLHANLVNHGGDIEKDFERWPWDRLVQVHYAGGRWSGGVLIDSHDSATSEAVWALFERIAARTPIAAAVLERDERLPPFAELLAETDRARGVMRRSRGNARAASAESAPPPPARTAPDDALQGLANTQAALARLFTDAGFRRGFLADPSQCPELEAIDSGAVERFADSLTAKRVLDARKQLPLTAAVLGRDFAPLLRAALRETPRPGRSHDDAAALALRLTADGGRGWIADLARYELALLEASRPGALFMARRFGWPPHRLAVAARSGAAEPARGASLGFWLRLPGGGKLRHWTL